MVSRPDSAAEVEAHLLRILRRYSGGGFARKLATALNELAEGEKAGLVAFDEGSDERQVEAVLAMLHSRLADLVLHFGIEIGTAVIEAREWLDDADPGDFGANS